MNRGYRWIHQLKKDLRAQGIRKTIPELLALNRNNDPFFMGSPRDFKMGEWFASMWEEKYNGQVGIHIRRVHYALQSTGFPKLDSMPYRNLKKDWVHLSECSRVARLLGLVPADAFDDRRNPDPHYLNWKRGDGQPSVIPSEGMWLLPSLRLNFSSVDWTLDIPRVEGYDPDDYLDRRYYLELWIEKSTMDDILEPLTEELGIRLIGSSGFQSISNCVKLLQRVRAIGKPARIFYVSDADEEGKQMPIAVARQIEYWLGEFAPGADIKLEALALTAEQIRKYELPSFLDSGAVELDALETLVPGELEKIVRAAVEPYLDQAMSGKLAAARREAKLIVSEEWCRLMGEPERKLEGLRKRVQSTAMRYQKQAARLNKLLERDLTKFKKPLAQLEAEVAARSSSFAPDLPQRPTQSTVEEYPDWLFDSSREYFDQLKFYKAQAKK